MGIYKSGEPREQRIKSNADWSRAVDLPPDEDLARHLGKYASIFDTANRAIEAGRADNPEDEASYHVPTVEEQVAALDAEEMAKLQDEIENMSDETIWEALGKPKD